MKKLIKSLAVLSAAVLMTACSSDEPTSKSVDSKGNFYSKLTLSLPVGSRSNTVNPDENTNSNSGFEIGQDFENNLQSVKVVIAVLEDGVYKYLTMAEGTPDANGNSSAHPNHVSYKLQFESSDLEDRAGEKVYVFAFANCPTDFTDADLKAALTNGTETIADANTDGIWTNNQFFMTNYSLTLANLPVAAELNTYTETNPFDLGVVEIERVASRFDFRATNNNIYPITEVAQTTPKANVILDGMVMANIAKEYYVLPRTSNNGLNANAAICIPENTTNWVVSPNETFKLTPTWANSGTYYFNAAGTYTTGVNFNDFTYTPVATILGQTEDSDENWTLGTDATGAAIDKSGYHIWRYTTENTLPGEADQIRGLSTSVYFRAHLEAAEGNTELEAAMTAGKPLYALNGVLYGDLAAVTKYIETNKVSTLADEWTKAAVEGNLDANGNLLSTGGSQITIYRPAEDSNYYMYYPYYNRHNDNYDNNEMGDMEFATVRNNVYKLAVSNIMHYGHPGDPGDDPDPEDPDDPDEEPEVYFTVELHVMPWVVRVNNIDF